MPEPDSSVERVQKAYDTITRAYSRLDIKAVDDERRVIKGIASTPSLDRAGDIVEPMGAEFAVPMALMLDHNHREQVGHVHFAKPTKSGIPFEAKIVKFDEPGEVKDLVDKAWHLVKTKLRSFVSIGFKPLSDGVELLSDGGLRFTRWEWLELSLVAIPANREAVILEAKSLDAAVREIKSLDQAAKSDDLVSLDGNGNATLADAGARAAEAERAGSSRKRVSAPVNLKREERSMSKTIAEQITALEAKRAANEARMAEIMTKAADEGRSTDEAEQDEFDTLEAEVETIDGDLKRFRSLAKINAATAKAVDDVQSPEDAAAARGGRVRVTSAKTAPGIRFARVVKCLGIAQGNRSAAADIAAQLYGDDQGVVNVLRAGARFGSVSSQAVQKAAVDAGGVSTWGAFLVGDDTNVFADFAEWLRPQTILGKFGTNGIPALRQVPFRVPLLMQDSGGAAYWVGEGEGKGLTRFTGSRTTLEPTKVANIVVLTEELVRDSSPSAEVMVRDQMAAAIREEVDVTFIDPANSGGGAKPAAITNNVSTTASTGASADHVRADFAALMAGFIAADNPPMSAVFIMSATSALQLSLHRTLTGAPEFPGITMNGGTFMGIPVIVSEYVGASPQSPTSKYVWLVNASDIYFGDDGDVTVDMSREASLQFDSAPAVAAIEPGSPSGGVGASLVSLWQTNSVGFRAERTLNWKPRRASAVQGLHGVQWQ